MPKSTPAMTALNVASAGLSHAGTYGSTSTPAGGAVLTPELKPESFAMSFLAGGDGGGRRAGGAAPRRPRLGSSQQQAGGGEEMVPGRRGGRGAHRAERG